MTPIEMYRKEFSISDETALRLEAELNKRIKSENYGQVPYGLAKKFFTVLMNSNASKAGKPIKITLKSCE